MISMGTLKRQHDAIIGLISNIRDTVRLVSLEKAADDLAIQISMLAGKIRVHMDVDDEQVYPLLFQNANPGIKETAKRFIDEMGDIGRNFADYKNKYNTKFKILANTIGFLKATEDILYALEKRIENEEKSLYPLIE